MIKNYKTGKVIIKGGNVYKKIIKRRKMIQQLGGTNLPQELKSCDIPKYKIKGNLKYSKEEAAFGTIHTVCIEDNCPL
jgi:hypothetical protein